MSGLSPRYIVAPCQGAFVVIDTAARVRIEGCRLAADGPFRTDAEALASCAALNRRRG